MNQEVMAVYKREGINPAGGCLQMLEQMPIWIGLNRALGSAIEMRHAPWFGWIKDLSARDPYYILPVIMAGTMYLQTKITPMTTTDPQQQMMMKPMPLSFAPCSSSSLFERARGAHYDWQFDRRSTAAVSNRRIR
jgi:YidC/Oxa1 family membrane protein insertase